MTMRRYTLGSWIAILCLCGFSLLAYAQNSDFGTQAIQQLPIHVVYVNHVEVESVIDYVPPLVDRETYTSTSEKYAFTNSQLEREIAQAENVGGHISFHMSGAHAERAVAAGDKSRWGDAIARGHTVGVHTHSFLRGANDFEWIYEIYPTQVEVGQHWEDNFNLVADLVGSEELWIGESHYGCQSCWQDLSYRLKTTEAMAQLPAGQHIVWLVERSQDSVITYPHFPQIGQAGWHGSSTNRVFFDLRIPQLKKEFLMLYLEWLERERLGLEPQVWGWGWCNHGGNNTEKYAVDIQEMLTWLSEHFTEKMSSRGNRIAEFVGDHELVDIYQTYELSGGQPLPSPLTTVNDQFPYMAGALTDAGVSADLTSALGLEGVRFFELESDPPEEPIPDQKPRVYLLFRENDGSKTVDVSDVLESRGISCVTLTLINVVDGAISEVERHNLTLGSLPLILEPHCQEHDYVDSPFGFHPAKVARQGYPDNGYVDAMNIGIKWTREGVYAFWFLVQPDLGVPDYDFTLYDQQWSIVPSEMRILGNIAPQGPFDESRCLPNSWLPINETQYVAFVKATVERYDGDGVDDMPGLVNPITYWQVGNEPNNNRRTDFAELQRITYLAIKQACPECQVLIGGVAGQPWDFVTGFNENYVPILFELNGQYMDIFDFHWYGRATGDYRLKDATTGQDVLDHIRTTLTDTGFQDSLPIWITEMGAYSGDPIREPDLFPFQSEHQQASDYFKRFIYPLSRGVQKVFPAFGLMEGFKYNDGYFDHTGLIYDGENFDHGNDPATGGDPGLGVKKLAYYTVKKMTEKLEGCDWENVHIIETGVENAHVYRFFRGELPVWVTWWDYFLDPDYEAGDATKVHFINGISSRVIATNVVPKYSSGSEVSDYGTAFFVDTLNVFMGNVFVPVGQDPVIIEVLQDPEKGDMNDDGMTDVLDVLRVVRLILHLPPPPTEYELWAADYNSDGRIDILDVVGIVNVILGGNL